MLATLERAFAHHAGPDGAIDLDDLKRALGIQSDYLARRMLAAFDIDGSGRIDREEFLRGVRALVFGDAREKLRFAFRLHDHDGDGAIDRIELMRMIGISLSEADTYRASQPPDALADALFARADHDRDGRITFDELEALVRASPHLLRSMTHSEAIWIAPNEELIALLEGGRREPRDWTAARLVALFIALHLIVVGVSLKLAPAGANAAYEVGRATARCIDLGGALILVPVMRRLLTRVRASALGVIIPVDRALDLHKLIGHGLFALACTHGAATSIAYASGHARLFAMFAHARALTGAALLVVFAVMWLLALPFVRRSRRFELFYFSHLLYVAWLALAVAHAPRFLLFVGAALVGFAIEQLLRLKRRAPSPIVHAEALRSGVTHIEVQKPAGFRASPGDYCFLLVPKLARHEWHPFTISSAPERDVLAFHVRSLGDWTSALRRRVEEQPSGLAAIVDGPYGAPSGDIFRSKHAVLIGAGIGVTPFASVLESLVLRANGESDRPSSLEKVHFLWLNKDQFAFEWFTQLLSELEQRDTRGLLEIHLCMTGGRSGASALGLELAREAMHAAGRRDVVTGLRTKTHMGQPDWDAMLGAIAREHAPATVDVFFCGPHGLGRKIKPVCAKHGMRFREEKF